MSAPALHNPGSHPRHSVDEVLTAPLRLSIIAALSRVDSAEFSTISDSLLSRQASTLESAGYVTVRKGYVGKRPRTWLSVTREGRAALVSHLAALRAIVEGLEG